MKCYAKPDDYHIRYTILPYSEYEYAPQTGFRSTYRTVVANSFFLLHLNSNDTIGPVDISYPLGVRFHTGSHESAGKMPGLPSNQSDGVVYLIVVRLSHGWQRCSTKNMHNSCIPYLHCLLVRRSVVERYQLWHLAKFSVISLIPLRNAKIRLSQFLTIPLQQVNNSTQKGIIVETVLL